MQIFKECPIFQATNITNRNNDRNLSFCQFWGSLPTHVVSGDNSFHTKLSCIVTWQLDWIACKRGYLLVLRPQFLDNKTAAFSLHLPSWTSASFQSETDTWFMYTRVSVRGDVLQSKDVYHLWWSAPLVPKFVQVPEHNFFSCWVGGGEGGNGDEVSQKQKTGW